ncbi:cytochrome P450 [Gymnopus androsaceus JB14]|uniref:Cytochrome P450 n=1 Tax=Gymnopus androsaceus JB14 TaxID=1447944 RepID=A0A6A4I747_9AGAR|nr:cytochrome P450 [Gymnopus androsaceus JB14]
MDHIFTSLGIAAAALALIYRVFLRRNRPSTSSYPPGPTVTSMPIHSPWIQYRNWATEYGELFYIQNRNILIVNNSRAAIDLLEKRARIYSDREMSAMVKLCGGELVLSIMEYSEKWRRNRKLFQQNFRQAASKRFYPAQYDKVHEFLRSLREHPIAHKAVEAIHILGEGRLAEIQAIKANGHRVAILAATDTTMSSVSSFLLAMTLHPDVQTKGQEEIDRVVGKDRLPTFDDRQSLPYVEAIYREVMRLHPPLPLGKHFQPAELWISKSDKSGIFVKLVDSGSSQRFAKGCVVVAQYLMNSSPSVLMDNETGPFTGYKRHPRIWIWAKSAKDKNGNEIEISGEYTDAVFSAIPSRIGPPLHLAPQMQRN